MVSVGYALHSEFTDTAEYARSAPPDDDWDIDTSGFNVFRMTGNVGIGTFPQYKLDVAGTAQMTGFKMPTDASDGYVLTSDASGIGTWEAEAGGIDGSGTANYIPKFADTTTLGNSVIYETGGNVGIGTTDPGIYKLDVRGDTRMRGMLRFADSTGEVYPHNFIGMVSHVEGTKKWLCITGIEDNTGDNLRRVGLWGGKVYLDGIVGIGTFYPSQRLDVEGYVQAYGYYTGDIIFQKDKEKLWRMFEDEDGLYLENLKTGKVYRFVLQEVEKE
jgi:hypothetical protein